ncbi:MAG TPA: SDR family NAD(P)-dependent oxidoreductase [Propionicimonas sp.]|nr:SDR family NAD(P)-dependent oxidoreductase [Propionicimonas sp.]
MNLREYLYEQVASHQLGVQEAKSYLSELSVATGHAHDVAVVGMACRLPEADDPEQFWLNLRDGRVSIRPLPATRHANSIAYIRAFHQADLIRENRINPDGSLRIDFVERGYVDQIEMFDAEFFGINPREAAAMDPNQRQLLETAYHALQDSGVRASSLAGSRAGVFVGIDHVEEHKYKRLASDDPLVVTGTWPGILASRLSYLWDLRGPSMVIDTACSSGLVAVHQACKSLQQGETDLALVGGLSSYTYEATTFEGELRALESVEAADSSVRTFDRSAAGTTWGEGVGVVVLKRLDEARRDGDRIHAVIRGSAINNDGASNGITAPNAEAQERLLLDAWNDARVAPDTITHVEAHGTGTVLGDPIEISALTKAFRHHTANRQFCGVGSVKPNIGHLVGASGIASLLKVIMMLKKHTYLGSLNFSEPNQFINFVESPVFVTDETSHWDAPAGSPRRAGINSFGFSGTNCHVVMEEAPPAVPTLAEPPSAPAICTISARSREQLEILIEATIRKIEEQRPELRSVCRTANLGREHQPWRVAVVAQSLNELVDVLRRVLAHPADAQIQGARQGHFRRIGAGKPNPQTDELTEAQFRHLAEQGSRAVADLATHQSMGDALRVMELYVRGADINWAQVHLGEEGPRADLPLYPFAQVPCWHEREPERDGEIRTNLGAVLTERSVSTPAGDHYLARFNASEHWVLTDHVILGQHIIPGTTYLELALEIAMQYEHGPKRVTDLVYSQPCVVATDETRDVVGIVEANSGRWAMRFVSEQDGDWATHATCVVESLTDKPLGHVNIEELRSGLEADLRVRSFDLKPRETAISLGPRWANERIVAVGSDSVLVELALTDDMLSDLHGAVLHVAMFDNAVNAISQKSGEGLYLPYHYREVVCVKGMPRRFYSHIRMNSAAWDLSKETITYDVDLFDPDGQIFATVRGYSTKHVDERAAGRIRETGQRSAIEFGWRRTASRETPAQGYGHALVVDGTELADALRAAGADVRTVDWNNLERCLSTSTPNRIVYATGWHSTNPMPSDEPDLPVTRLLTLAKYLDALSLDHHVDLVVVGTGAGQVGPNDLITPEANSLAALANAIGLEFEGLSTSYVDAQPGVPVDLLAAEILAANGGLDRFVRADGSWVRELRKATLPEAKPLAVAGNHYLITGGTGELGLALADRLSDEAQVTIALVSHTDWNNPQADPSRHEALTARLDAIRNKGSIVEVHMADVTEREAMAQIVKLLRHRSLDGHLAGIFHCAGLAGDGIIVNKSEDTFRRVFDTKARGAMLLDELTRDDPPGYMVLYSSVLSVFGDIGQADYMAANAYLDAFTDWRNAQGRRTLTLNWPAWLEVGMAVRYGVAGADNTMASLPTETALNLLSGAMTTDLTRVMPGQLSATKIQSHKGLRCALGDGLQFDGPTPAAPPTQAAESAFEESAKYTPTERALLRVWADTLQVKRIDIYDSFTDLGGQSFLAIQLYKAINRELDEVIEVADIYSFPSVQLLAAEIDRRASPVPAPADVNDLIEQINQGRTSISNAVRQMKAH